MTSSMLTGERRWASGRRSGMTVLGKVAVPKPINLPSQKLENHGMDPNVEIVPKGTLSWGSRQSSSTSNAWGSSTLSPKADSGTGSPSHLSGRPSSGGSGTRPSTGSSDKVHESIASAWSSNSRPSSASGALTSNQTSLASLRPRSAETRPGSSQLSRFAESLPERSVAWGAGAAEKLGVATSRKDGFSLTSGDFPTLGSEKENAEKDTESQDNGSHGRPGSSGGAGPMKDRTGTSIVGDVPLNSNTKDEPASSWRRHNTPYDEDGIRPSVEKWPVDPQGHQPYPNTGIPPQHYDAWPGPPMNNHPGSVWYRGPPGGPPYGAPVPPGGFPMEPYHFYRPHIPQALPNSQPAPPPGAGPRAHHPKNGDIYRPHMPDAFVRPGVPLRPGFYPGPVPYESYYGPPMGYPNPNEREVPFVGRPAGPAYNRHSAQSAHNPGDFHSRPCGYGSNGKALPPEQMESSNSNDTRGPYRVLLKQHDCWDGKQEHKREESLTANASLAEKGDQLRSVSVGDDLKGGNKNEEEIGLRRKPFGEKSPFQTSDYDGGSLVHAKVKSPESKRNAMAVEEISMKKVELTASAFREIPAGQKDSSLMQKIEGLNAKTRGPEGRHDLMSVSTREEQKNRSQAMNVGFNNSIKEAASGSFYSERDNTSCINNPVVGGVDVSAGDKSIESPAASGAASSRRSTQGMHGRTDHHGQGKYNAPEGAGWRRKFMDSNVTSATHSGTVSNVHMQERAHKEATEKSGSYPQAKNEGNSATSDVDPSDDKAQRAKMRELAKQRVQQRQKEEEERLREQKAKALAKLEELNKRKLPAEDSKKNLDSSLTNAAENKQEESHFVAEATVVSSQSVALTSAVVSDSNFVKQVSDAGSGVDKSTILGNELLPERPKSGHNEHVPTRRHGVSEPMKQGNADVVPHSNVLQVYDLGASKQKRVSYKQKHNISVEKNSDISITTGTTEPQKIHTDVDANIAASPEHVANETASDCGTNAPVNANVTAEPSIHQRRRNNRSGKKHKMEEAASAATLSPVVQKETIIFGTSGERGKTTVSEPEMKPELDSGAFQSRTDSKDENQFSEKRISSPNEENRGRASNQWKSQHSRRPRSSQANKSADKFHTTDAVIWAPVRSQNKVEVTGEAGQKTVIDAPSNKSEHQVQNNLRNRRAELERYVPKPVAKEMAQRGSSQQQVAPSVDQTATSDETMRRPNCGSQLVESSQPASKNGDSRLNKQGKAHGSWRQRTSAEASVVQGSQGGDSLNSNRNVQKPIEQQQPEMIDVCQVKEQPKYQNEWGFSDGWTMPEDPDATVPPPVIVKDLGVSARGKRHQYKGPKGIGNNYDHEHKKIISEDFEKTHIQSSVPAAEMSSKENRVVGDRSSSHWQPKPQTFWASNQQGSRPNSGQNIRAEAGMANKKVVSDILAQSHHGQSSSQMPSKFEEAPNAGNQEMKRERRMTSAKGRPHSPNHGPALENAPLSKPDTRYEQRMPSGFRRSGNQNNRSGRGHETRGDWSSSGQDDKQHTQPLNRERQRHNSHYEYQPVGHGPHYSGSRANNYEVPKDGPSNTGGRYKERGPNHPRRGGVNFHGRASGTVRAADGYD